MIEISQPQFAMLGRWTCLFIITISLTYCLVNPKIRQILSSTRAKKPKNDIISDIFALKDAHEVARHMGDMIMKEGGGSWPPRASYNQSWPSALRPYHAIYLAMAPLLSISESDISLDNAVNIKRIDAFRSKMRQLLHELVNMTEVNKILSAAEKGHESILSASAYNGFYGCIAASRHAYRWGLIPVSAAAQTQKLIDFPPELSLPWPYMCRRYGVNSMGGNVTSNFLYNFDDNDAIVYEINNGRSKKIQHAEYQFAHIFPVVEERGLPVYANMIKSIISFEQGDAASCLNHLRALNSRLREPFQAFYDALVDSKIGRDVWMRYCQGFQGWGAGEEINGEYVEYDGLSGSHLTLIHCIDAFLGIKPYFDGESMARYIPEQQRTLSVLLRKYSFRERAKGLGYDEIEEEMLKAVKQLRLFRTSHRERARGYLTVPSQERLIMTAGRSVLESSDTPTIKEVLLFLEGLLVKRLKDTK